MSYIVVDVVDYFITLS